MMLTDLEAVFRSLNSDLGLRPLYHSKEARTDAHLFNTRHWAWMPSRVK